MHVYCGCRYLKFHQWEILNVSSDDAAVLTGIKYVDCKMQLGYHTVTLHNGLKH